MRPGWICACCVSVLLAGCLTSSTESPRDLDTIRQESLPSVHSDAQAITIADLFLTSQDMEWGKATAVLRTVANWYRVEYQDGDYGQERFVLVDPEDGSAEFPLTR